MQVVAVDIRVFSEQVLQLLPVYGHAGVFHTHTMALERIDGIDNHLAIGQQAVFRGQVNFLKLNIKP
jgi:hypothetical protein